LIDRIEIAMGRRFPADCGHVLPVWRGKCILTLRRLIMKFTPYVMTWAILAVIVLALALYRNLMALHEDDNLHIATGEEPLIPKQLAFYRVMDRIDRWGEGLTAITVAGGLVLAAIYMYSRLPA